MMAWRTISGGGGGGDFYQALDRPASPSNLVPIRSSPSPPLRPSPSPPLPPSPLPSVGIIGVSAGGVNCIEHPVSKLDTLAGVAIKYGVEVADIKKINGLVADLQMFALKTLYIPLPGRHPPSPSLSNGSDTQRSNCSELTPTLRRHSDLFDSFQSLKLKASPQRKVSSAMSSLQGYYGIKPTDHQKADSEGFEMAVYGKGGSHYLEDGPFAQPLSLSNQPLSHNRKSRSLADGLKSENGDVANDVSTGEGDSDRWMEKLMRRRQKSEADFSSRTPELLLKEENSSGGGFSPITGKGLALRPKAASRTISGFEPESGNSIPNGLVDSLLAESCNVVRKSSSTSSLQDSDNSSSSSIWPTSKWSLKPDLQALSTGAITRPIFDGLPKPSNRKTKAALD